jgi:hypothetical protein
MLVKYFTRYRTLKREKKNMLILLTGKKHVNIFFDDEIVNK